MSLWLVSEEAQQLAPLFADLPRTAVMPPAAAAAALAAGPPPALLVNWSRHPLGDQPNSLPRRGQPTGRLLNRPAGLAVLADGAQVERRLQLNGLPPGGQQQFSVGILDLQVYGVQRLGPAGQAGSSRSAGPPGPVGRQGRGTLGWRRWERVTGAALRALACLGLDSGVVNVALVETGGPPSAAVGGIRLGPLLDRGALARLKKLLLGYLRPPGGAPAAKVQPRLGADPEFMLRHRRSRAMLAASRFFHRRGTVGCDTQSGPQPGEYPVGEIRPRPTTNPDLLLLEMRRCLQLAYSRTPGADMDWLAGGRPFPRYPIGGHIHFSGWPLSGQLLRALDTYLAVPVFLIERPALAAARRRRYGFLSDVRLKGHGGYEYRTLPSWLVDPALARAVLHLAWLIVRWPHLLPRALFDDFNLQQAFYYGEQGPLRRHVAQLWADVSRLPGYRQSSKALAPLQQLVQRGRCWPEGGDFSRRWRLTAGAHRSSSRRAASKRAAGGRTPTPPPSARHPAGAAEPQPALASG